MVSFLFVRDAMSKKEERSEEMKARWVNNIKGRSSGGLSDAKAESMVQDAEQMRKAGNNKKEAETAKNDGEALYYHVETVPHDEAKDEGEDWEEEARAKRLKNIFKVARMQVPANVMDSAASLAASAPKTNMSENEGWSIAMPLYLVIPEMVEEEDAEETEGQNDEENVEAFFNQRCVVCGEPIGSSSVQMRRRHVFPREANDYQNEEYGNELVMVCQVCACRPLEEQTGLEDQLADDEFGLQPQGGFQPVELEGGEEADAQEVFWNQRCAVCGVPIGSFNFCVQMRRQQAFPRGANDYLDIQHEEYRNELVMVCQACARALELQQLQLAEVEEGEKTDEQEVAEDIMMRCSWCDRYVRSGTLVAWCSLRSLTDEHNGDEWICQECSQLDEDEEEGEEEEEGTDEDQPPPATSDSEGPPDSGEGGGAQPEGKRSRDEKDPENGKRQRFYGNEQAVEGERQLACSPFHVAARIMQSGFVRLIGSEHAGRPLIREAR